VYDKEKHIELLETTNQALADKIANLTKRKMARTDETTKKWRGRAFYYKRQVEALVNWMRVKGIEVPALVNMEKEAKDGICDTR
jgi:hypothetical protein